MFSSNLIISIGIVFILILLFIIFVAPAEEKKVKKRRKSPSEETPDQKDWKKTALRLERHIHSLREEILTREKNEKELQKQCLIEQTKVKKFQEKLSQERQWHEKEEKDIDQRAKEFKMMKAELIKLQDQFGKEHALTLKFQNEIKEARREIDQLQEQKRSVEGENINLKAKNDYHRQEIAHLKKDNAELSKKKEDTQWVAKTEYMQIEKELRETKKALDKLNNS